MTESYPDAAGVFQKSTDKKAVGSAAKADFQQG
jgi:hypothetical protein